MWFLSALPLVGKLFGTIDNVTNAIKDKQIALINATNETERSKIQAELNRLQAIASLQGIEANSKNQLNAHVRFILFGLPAGIAIWKLVVWDKVIGSFVGCTKRYADLHPLDCRVFGTDSFDPNMWWVILAAASFYLVTSMKK